NHVLDIWFGVEFFFPIVFDIVYIGLVVYLIELDFYVFGVAAFVNISYKLIRQDVLFIEITLISIFNFKKPANGTSCPSLTNHMIYRLVFIHGILYGDGSFSSL